MRGLALGALVSLTVMTVSELGELRGEVAFARFHCMRRLADKLSYEADLTRAVRTAAMEAELVMTFSEGDPDALWEVVIRCLGWSGREELDPLLRLQLGEKAARAAVLSVRAAPSDYESWLWFARTQAALGLWEKAEHCLKRARELAPPGMPITLFGGEEEWRGNKTDEMARRRANVVQEGGPAVTRRPTGIRG